MKKTYLNWISVILIGCSLLFANSAYNISKKRLYRVYWGGVTSEFLKSAKTNPKEFKITKEPSIIIKNNHPDATEDYYSVSELDTFTNKGTCISVHLFTFDEFQQQPLSSIGPETKKNRTKQQTFFYSYLFFSFFCLGGAFIILLKSKK
jgi:hypothetical protein